MSPPNLLPSLIFKRCKTILASGDPKPCSTYHCYFNQSKVQYWLPTVFMYWCPTDGPRNPPADDAKSVAPHKSAKDLAQPLLPKSQEEGDKKTMEKQETAANQHRQRTHHQISSKWRSPTRESAQKGTRLLRVIYE